ncbi:stage 0 sporulation family protein [Lewinella sp. IMCC34183]|uniref:PSP1 domain-containing protein n=1 Tax=Lewinella sp. IMCC34183 TaxID=2248762 RepID=UPI001E5786FC|nr:regulatory iron-sulfur-containing complex subunit RicT [Lewinella sp. IMCC34183]
MSTFDWLSHLGIDDSYGTDIVEVSFKDGASKEFYHAPPRLGVFTGDLVAVETSNGYNVGCITLSGELVRLQLKKKGVKEAKVTESVLRKANERDREKLAEARELEIAALTKARVIARTNHVPMKVTDVEYQGDCRKATIYYTADERIDFRQLVRQFSHQLRVKIEMRQIGPRQESARLGGIGSCGRELCCSTWLSDFHSVNTAAARYQNIAINQSKLSGQCGRLKCCLNYELDTYMEALEAFPRKADKLRTEAGTGILIKTDIFKGLMYYTYREDRGLLFPLPVDKVHEILALNKEGQKPANLQSFQAVADTPDDVFEYEDVTGAVELPAEKRRRKQKSGKSRKSSSRRKSSSEGGASSPPAESKSDGNTSSRKRRSKNRNRRRSRKDKPKGGE